VSEAQQPELSKEAADVIIKVYKQMLTSLFLGTLLTLVVGFVLFYPFLRDYFVLHNTTNPSDVPLVATVMLTGALGAFFSALTRLYSFDALPRVVKDPKLDLPSVQLLMYSLIPAVVGAIAALILYLAFAGDLISGELFPKISCREIVKDGLKGCVTFGSLLSTDAPPDAENFAKVLVWSFIAGFAERLVPNTLDSLSKAVSGSKKS
jgi:hypothetical protein